MRQEMGLPTTQYNLQAVVLGNGGVAVRSNIIRKLKKRVSKHSKVWHVVVASLDE
jgi:hypothetical protein